MLFAGAESAGRRATMHHLTGGPAHSGVDGYWNARVTKEARTTSGEPILLHARVPTFGSLWIPTYRAGLESDIEWIREAASSLLELLPTLDGIIFVARADQLGAAVHSLRGLCEELPRAGIDLRKLPVVFQCNQRDRYGAVRMEQMIAELSTPRCAHVESVAAAGYGVQRAFDTLVTMIDDPGASFPPPPALPVWRAAPPSMLFEELEAALTGDGAVRAALLTTTRETGLTLDHAALRFGWEDDVVAEIDFEPGRYAIDVAKRRVTVRAGDGLLYGAPAVVAVRVHLPGSVVTRRAPLWDGPACSSRVVLGAPREVHAVGQFTVASEAYDRICPHGAALLVEREGRFVPVESASLAILDVDSSGEVHLTLGRDGAGRAIELTYWGDRGTKLLARGSP